MTQINNVTTQPVHTASLSKRMFQGAGIALILIVIFLAGVKESDPAWGKLWMLKPLIIVPLAGAIGGALYYFMETLRYQGSWGKIVVTIVSVIGYIIILWLGTVLGLNGTLWN